MKNHGYPGRGEGEHGTKRGAFPGGITVSYAGVDFARQTSFAIGHFVMRFRIDDPAECIVLVAAAEGGDHLIEVALLVLGHEETGPDRMYECTIPLRAEAGTSAARVLHQPGIVAQILGDRDELRPRLAKFIVEPLAKIPSVAERVARILRLSVATAHINCGVPAQTVDAIKIQPHQGIVLDVRSDFTATIVGPAFAPWGGRTPIIIEIDSAKVVFIPTIELPQAQVTRTKMIINHVENHCYSFTMGGIDECLEPFRAAIGRLNGPRMSRVVPPGTITGEFSDRHDFNRVYSQVTQVRQFFNGRGERARSLTGARVECADVQFVNNQVVKRRGFERNGFRRFALCFIGAMLWGPHDPVPDRAGDFDRTRVDARKF